MRNRSFATLGTLTLLAAASAFGQQKMRVDIPFEFRFANSVMPAGQYDVDRDSSNVRNLLSLECRACRVHTYSITFPTGGGTDTPDVDRLVFNKYGETYFLAEVWTSGQSQGVALGKSKTEREIARITLPGQTSQVILAQR